MSIAENLQKIRTQIGEATLIAVSKGRSCDEILEAYAAGQRDFGENRVQEALAKMEELPRDIRWHFIGKLQKNKVNKVIGRFALIHSVDSYELAKRISEASRNATPILLEANTSGEATKSGLSPTKWEELFPQVLELKGIEVKGLMTMAPLTDNRNAIRSCFAELRRLRDRLGNIPFLSMGMSNDYLIAIEEGATHVRIGTALFDG